MQNILDLQLKEFKDTIIALGEPMFRANQIQEGIFHHLYDDWQQFTNLPLPLRTQLNERFEIGNLELLEKRLSENRKSEKLLFKLPDGNVIESVLLSANGRTTLCISTQSGCPVGCVFCATGKMGFYRNLTPGEIIEQIIYFLRHNMGDNNSLDNIVLMGMGEPFLNYVNVLNSIRTVIHPDGLNIGARRITISTIGIAEKIRQFTQENLQVNLAVSLHSPIDELRKSLIPIAQRESIKEIIGACRGYFDGTGRRVTFEYVMIDNVNDSIALAEKLSIVLKGLNCHVNLIQLNPNAHYSGRRSSMNQIKQFVEVLINHHIPTSIRSSLGSDILAGCGQLAGQITIRD